jgi:hypothetical protein
MDNPTTELHDFFLQEYLLFINNSDALSILIKIITACDDLFLTEISIFRNPNLTIADKKNIVSVIIFKSINKFSSIESIYDVNYSSTDRVLNNITESFSNMSIFYNGVGLMSDELHKLKGFIFKFIKVLVFKKIVISDCLFYRNKTLEKWSFGNKNLHKSYTDTLKISPRPLKIKEINGVFYVIGDFFTLIKKIYLENIKSGSIFALKNKQYTENMLKSQYYINIDDLKSIIDLLLEKNINYDNIHNGILNSNYFIKENLKKISYNKSQIKLIIQNNVDNTIKLKFNSLDEHNFINYKEYIIDAIYQYARNYYKLKFNINLLENDKYKFIQLLYTNIKSKFDNVSLLVRFQNYNTLTEDKDCFSEYKIDLELEYANHLKKDLKFSPAINKKNKIKFDIKLDPQNIDFIRCLWLLNRKELNKILKITKKMLPNINEMTVYNLKNISFDSYRKD